jgi:hypothetical protein
MGTHFSAFQPCECVNHKYGIIEVRAKPRSPFSPSNRRCSTVQPTSDNADYLLARRVTMNGAILDFVLGVVKVVVGWLAQSQALIADGIHSLSDLATDFLVVIAARHGSRAADAQHPYGHDRIETVASVVLASARHCRPWYHLQRRPGCCPTNRFRCRASLPWLLPPHPHCSRKVSITTRFVPPASSNRALLKANAWHSRTDALSSVVVMVGVGGALIGFPWADAVAAIGVSALILQVAWSIGQRGNSRTHRHRPRPRKNWCGYGRPYCPSMVSATCMN